MTLSQEAMKPDLGVAPATVRSPAPNARSVYLTELLNARSALAIPGLQSVRDRAESALTGQAIPSTREEAWRFTDLSALLNLSLEPSLEAAEASPVSLGFSQLTPFLLPEATNSRLVFVDGIYAPDLSAIDDLPAGMVVSNLATGWDLIPTIVGQLAQQPNSQEVFTALNTASFSDGAIIYLPKHQVSSAPIHLLFVSTGHALNHPRCLVVAETGSQLTLVEESVSLTSAAYFTNPVTEIWLGENAEIRHTRVQRDSAAAIHIGKTAVSQARDSRYHCCALSLGGLVSRHHLEVYQTGAQTETDLRGLTLLTGEQVGDTHSLIALNHPHGSSNQVNKTIVRDRAHAIFNGRITVAKAAQMTDAAQLSRNLLLSPKARVDTKPQLEIIADNVKCAHGATVSQLEDDEVFYLQSRGIPADRARQLLTYAFAIEVINQVPLASLREHLVRSVQTAIT